MGIRFAEGMRSVAYRHLLVLSGRNADHVASIFIRDPIHFVIAAIPCSST